MQHMCKCGHSKRLHTVLSKLYLPGKPIIKACSIGGHNWGYEFLLDGHCYGYRFSMKNTITGFLRGKLWILR